MSLQVRLTLDQTSGLADLWSDVPHRQGHLVAKFVTTLGQVDILSDLWVRLTFGQMYPMKRPLVAKCVTTLGQVDILSDLQVRLTFGQMYPHSRDILCPSVILLRVRLTLVRSSGQVDLWLDVPPTGRHLVAKCITTSVRLTFGQM